MLTRPLGASVADWMGKPSSAQGLGWGDGTVSAAAIVLVVGVVGWLSLSRHGVPADDEPRGGVLPA